MHHFRVAWASQGRSAALSRPLFGQVHGKNRAHVTSFSRPITDFRPTASTPSSIATNLSDRHQRTQQSAIYPASAIITAPPLKTVASTRSNLQQNYDGPKIVAEEPQASGMRKKVLLLMSGGVDSSMCAVLLKEQGYDVTGLYMHNWNHEEETRDTPDSNDSDGTHVTQQQPRNTAHLSEHLPPMAGRQGQRSKSSSNSHPKVCSSERDWADVQSVCKALEIPCRRLDFSRQYWHQVFEVMLQAYEQGFTPNPDIDCNREIKFGELVEWCRANGGLGPDRPSLVSYLPTSSSSSSLGSPEGWDYLATGHYANVEIDQTTGRAKLMQAVDSNKDQTYYLSTLSEHVLRHVLFPLAKFDKPTIKAMAATHPTLKRVLADKKESMGICFVGQRRRFGEFLKEYLQPKPGLVRVGAVDGKVIGQHQGLFQYTVGQASGVTFEHYKWVVLRTDMATNTLIVVEGTQNPLLYSPGLIAGSWHWISGQAPRSLRNVSGTSLTASNVDYPFVARIRHRQTPQPCRIEVILPTTLQSPSSNAHVPQFRVLFKDAQRAIAPGQQIVLYQDDECLGGGVILSSLPSSPQ